MVVEEQFTKSIPIKVLQTRLIQDEENQEEQWLIQWSEGSIDDATWEKAKLICSTYPDLVPWGQGRFKQGGCQKQLKMNKLQWNQRKKRNTREGRRRALAIQTKFQNSG
ncbi:Chromo-like domain superfamily [Abeliophyllum distichum]|uniref:Chromo-like domain superfamily n=1 Tax=Abeliophyllum distichum TaxID=126358 RepID=A0ABD1UQJ1_9LAMI